MDLCGICDKKIKIKSKTNFCQLCRKPFHLKYSSMSRIEYQNNPEIYCKKCNIINFPFSDLNNNQFFNIIKQDRILNDFKIHPYLNLSDSEKNIIDSLNNIINEGGDNEGETSFGCKYYDIDEFNNNFKNPDNFSILHLNIHSIQFHIEDLRLALQSINNKFDIIAISESKINADIDPTVDITLDDFHPPVGTPTKASKGGVLLYISTELNFKPRHDLDIYKDR